MISLPTVQFTRACLTSTTTERLEEFLMSINMLSELSSTNKLEAKFSPRECISESSTFAKVSAEKPSREESEKTTPRKERLS